MRCTASLGWCEPGAEKRLNIPPELPPERWSAQPVSLAGFVLRYRERGDPPCERRRPSAWPLGREYGWYREGTPSSHCVDEGVFVFKTLVAS